MRDEEKEKREEPVRRKRKKWKRWAVLFLILAILIGSGGLVWWKGPEAGLRWAVRSWDPALRMKSGKFAWNWKDGELVLRDVGVFFHGRETAIFEVREVRLGFGSEWRKGRFGALVLDAPVVSLDKKVIEHFQERFAGSEKKEGGGWSWQIGRVEVREGHFWVENFGEPGLDISTNVDGVLEGFGTFEPGQVHELDLSTFYVAVHLNETPLPLLGAGMAKLRFSLEGVEERKLESLRVDAGWFLAGAGLEVLKVMDEGKDAKEAPSEEKAAFVVGALDLVDLQIHTGEVMAGLPQFSVKVNTALRDVGIGTAVEELAEKIHQVEFSDIDILSPVDPLKQAVTVRTVFVKFSLAGLGRQEIEELIVLSPTIYVGEALFEVMEASENPKKAETDQMAASAGWKVKKLDVNFGKLVIAVGGRSRVGLPLTFQTQAENVSLSSLAGMNVDLVMTIPRDDYEFPDYELTLSNVRGDVRLNYPPTDHKQNLVNVVKLDKARWRNFTGTNLWVSVTFDMKGINGLFGGEAYGGYISGGFSFFLQPDSPWTGWLSGTGIDLGRITKDAAPQHFVMTGKADVKLEVNGSGPEIERVLGVVNALGSGRVSVNKLNDFLEAMPKEWNPLKREIFRVGLEALRDFDYTKASGDFWFVGREGLLTVKMKGSSGSRNIEIALHDGDSGDAMWSKKGAGR